MFLDEKCWEDVEGFSNDLGWRMIRKGVGDLKNEGSV